MNSCMRAQPVTVTVINVLTSCFFSTNRHRPCSGADEQHHSAVPAHGTTD